MGPISPCAVSAAAARVPACRIVPPQALRSLLHFAMNSRVPTMTLPTGAPNALDRHTDTESAASTARAGVTPSAAAAFHILAPSMCRAMPCSLANSPHLST